MAPSSPSPDREGRSSRSRHQWYQTGGGRSRTGSARDADHHAVDGVLVVLSVVALRLALPLFVLVDPGRHLAVGALEVRHVHATPVVAVDATVGHDQAAIGALPRLLARELRRLTFGTGRRRR